MSDQKPVLPEDRDIAAVRVDEKDGKSGIKVLAKRHEDDEAEMTSGMRQAISIGAGSES